MRTSEMLLKAERPPFVICLLRLVSEIPVTSEDRKGYFSGLDFLRRYVERCLRRNHIFTLYLQCTNRRAYGWLHVSRTQSGFAVFRSSRALLIIA